MACTLGSVNDRSPSQPTVELALEAWRAVTAAARAIEATSGVSANEYAALVAAELANVYSLARRTTIEDAWCEEPDLEAGGEESEALRAAIRALLGEHPFKGFGGEDLEGDLLELHARLAALATIPEQRLRERPGSFLVEAYQLELCGHLGDHVVEVIRSLHFYLSGVWPAPDAPPV